MAEPAEDVHKWLDAQLDAADELVDLGSEALRRRRTSRGAEALQEAEAILEMAERRSDRLLQTRARIFNELGVVWQRRKDLEQSRRYHAEAAEICDELMERGVDFAGNAAATLLNLSSIQLALDDRATARDSGERALEFLDELERRDERSGPDPLELGARQNLAIIYARDKDWERANELMEQGREVVDELFEAGRPDFLGQFARGCQQLSVVLFENDRHEDALYWGRQAEKLSERGFDTLGQQVLPVYIVSQINLISYYEKLGQYADAEDCLWKAIDVAGDEPRILYRGVSFYETCRKQARGRLERGNLPRDEVEEGYEELKEHVEAAGGLEQIRREVQRQRSR